jgi:hypothetical protein
MKVLSIALWGRALAVWLLIAAVETLHGVLRALYLVPAIGEAAAQRIGFVVASVLVVAVAWLSSRWLGATTHAAQLKVGLLWLLLMFGFELAVGRARGYDWPRIGAAFDPAQGGLMIFGLALMGLAPMLGAWLRGLRRV